MTSEAASVEQLALTELWTCDVCQGTGRETDPETGLERRCRVCQGAGTLSFDPLDTSEFGF